MSSSALSTACMHEDIATLGDDEVEVLAHAVESLHHLVAQLTGESNEHA